MKKYSEKLYKNKNIYILYIMNYKNNIFILRNIHKSNDEELIDYTFKKILPKIYNYYKENRNTNEIIYNIDNCYKEYFPNLYLELLDIYNLSDLTKLIYRKKYL